jgi:nitrite reductase/ring-hydroxylating ferredoxin subunit
MNIEVIVCMKNYDKLKVEMNIINLDGTTTRDSDISNVISHVQAGKLVILRKYLQHINLLNEIEQYILDCVKSVCGEQIQKHIAKNGLEYIHEHLNAHQIKALYYEIRIQLANKMPAVTVSMYRSFGVVDPFYVHDGSLIRMMLPYHMQQEYAKDSEELLGKLTLHGPHHDFYQNVPLNAVNTWIALGRVKKENSMFIYPDCWGKHIPQGEEAARKDQYLGVPLEFSLERGDALFFHSNHMHSSRINTTDQTRVVLTNRICTELPKYPNPNGPQKYIKSTNFDVLNEFDGLFSKPGFIGNPKSITPEWLRILMRIKSRLIKLETTSALSTKDECSLKRPKILEAREIDLLKEGEVCPINEKMCVARSEGKLAYFSRYCPHQGADLSLGYLDKDHIVCPYHGAKFSTKSGQPNCEGLRNLTINQTE